MGNQEAWAAWQDDDEEGGAGWVAVPPEAAAAETEEEEEEEEDEEEEAETEQVPPAPRHLLPFCCVLYTSGSTGAPLGVCGTEEGVLNRCQWMQTAHPLARGDRVALRTPPCFVDAVAELFGPLLAGAMLVVVPPQAAADPARVRVRGRGGRARLPRCVGGARVDHVLPLPLHPLTPSPSSPSC